MSIHHCEYAHVSFQLTGANIEIIDGPDQDMSYGGVLSQICRVNKPGFRFHWVLPNQGRIQGAALRIRNIQYKHSGRYWCYAENPQTGEKLKAWYELGK